MVDPHNTDRNDGDVHGHSTIRDVPERDKGGMGWLPWVLGALLLLGLLWLLTRDNERDDAVVEPDTVEEVSTTAVPATTAAATTNGGVVNQTAAVAYRDRDLDTYLAGTEPLGRAYTLDNVNFATGSAEITDRNAPDVASLAATLKKYPASKVTLTGFADPSGAADMNQKLSADRANAVKAALVAAGIAADRIATSAEGETGSAAVRANRKVEMRVTAR